MMRNGAVLDTGFLITLVDANRPFHETAKAYYRHFLENSIPMYLPTVVVSEFCLKQPITDLPLHNFQVLPFNLFDAVRCAGLNVATYRKQIGEGQRDAVKDDFKIIAQAEENDASFLVTEDRNSMSRYCDQLRNDGAIRIRVIVLSIGSDLSRLNDDGQLEIPYPSAT